MTLSIQLTLDEERKLGELADSRGLPVDTLAHEALGAFLKAECSTDPGSQESEGWLTGEEYQREWRRLRDAGHRSQSVEMKALLRRLSDQDAELWKRFGVVLMGRFPGKWAAVDQSGAYVLAESELEVRQLAEARFGPFNAGVFRLVPDRGTRRLGPRSAL